MTEQQGREASIVDIAALQESAFRVRGGPGTMHRPEERRPRARGSLRIALMGTRGVPARYGGFETALEEVGQRLAARGHEVTVYCRNGNSGDGQDPSEYLGMHLVHLPALRHRSLETLSHTFYAAAHLAAHPEAFDAVIMCNAANALAIPLLRLSRAPVAVNMDGLEWRRTKWGHLGRRYYRAAESLSVRWADALVADARGIQDYYREEFGADTVQIPYGAPDLTDTGSDRLAELDLRPGQFHLLVARFEPENNVTFMIEGYLRRKASWPLVVVGSTPYPTHYSDRIDDLAARSPQVRLVGPVWDQGLLDQLYKGALTYVHGHSVGGTNPSLLRAMGAATGTIAYDCVFNREVAGPLGVYCTTPDDVAVAIQQAEADPVDTVRRGAGLAARACERYTWDGVTDAYEQLCRTLASGASQRTLFTGRRRRSGKMSTAPDELGARRPTAAPSSRDAADHTLTAPPVSNDERRPERGPSSPAPSWDLNPAPRAEKADHEEPAWAPPGDRLADRRLRARRSFVGQRHHGRARTADRDA